MYNLFGNVCNNTSTSGTYANRSAGSLSPTYSNTNFSSLFGTLSNPYNLSYGSGTHTNFFGFDQSSITNLVQQNLRNWCGSGSTGTTSLSGNRSTVIGNNNPSTGSRVGTGTPSVNWSGFSGNQCAINIPPETADNNVVQYKNANGEWSRLVPGISVSGLSPDNIRLFNQTQGSYIMGNSSGAVVARNSDGSLSISFEDRHGSRAENDGDYNDVVVTLGMSSSTGSRDLGQTVVNPDSDLVMEGSNPSSTTVVTGNSNPSYSGHSTTVVSGNSNPKYS
ncbi:hypothetical protein [Thiolinea disciformis]|uniref:hypothetical protein n=1 Tax=Thiolinea disciformis TaxID=125614 RepID=UPI000364141F|nr:hypothetical protein [Thiolinea disciformis]